MFLRLLIITRGDQQVGHIKTGGKIRRLQVQNSIEFLKSFSPLLKF